MASNDFIHVGNAFLNKISQLVQSKSEEDSSSLFETLDKIQLDEGFRLGLKLAEEVGIGDVSLFYTYQVGDNYQTRGNRIEQCNREMELFKTLIVEPSAMGVWQSYLLHVSPSVLPLFWHGGYNKKTHIFSEADLAKINPIGSRRPGKLEFRDEVLAPTASFEGNTGIVECCFWNDWIGLVRESVEFIFDGNKVVSIKPKESTTLHQFHCCIIF